MIGYYGKIEDFWSDHLKNYKYVRQVEFNRPEWNEEYKTGFLLQSFDDELPIIWKKFKDILNLNVGTVGWMNIRPNQIVPPHTDNFYMLRQEYDAHIENCVRFLVFLEDWKFGQHVEFDTISISKWCKGDVWMFDYQSRHWAVNASNENFHTCQISTIKTVITN